MTRTRPCVIVIKLGTSSIVHEETHQPLLSTLSAIVETVVELRRQGHKVVLVSSGAIGVGLKRMDMASRPKSLAGKQALAAIGQGRLIALWDNLFGQLGQPIAQVLLTRGDISDRTRYLNAVNTFKELLHLGVVPIVNENDTVSVSEIKFGDNDTLSAITSSMLHADYLFLLTDVDGLYTSNPRKDPDAKAIEEVASVTAIRQQVSTNTLGSKLGTGGMETKLIAAEIASAAGVMTIICSSKNPENLIPIIHYHDAHNRHKHQNTSAAAATPEISRPASPAPTPQSSEPTQQAVVPRPPHTAFLPSSVPVSDLKSWTSHTLYPAGTIIVDVGAYRVLSRRESGGRLLAVGVIGVIGAFASGQAVRIAVRRTDLDAAKNSEGDAGGPSQGFDRRSSRDIYRLSGSHGVEPSPGVSAHPSRSPSPAPAPDEGDGSQYGEIVEVGRGLANYNSSQIARVKGLNSTMLPQFLGYADSEYVVENVTIRSIS